MIPATHGAATQSVQHYVRMLPRPLLGVVAACASFVMACSGAPQPHVAVAAAPPPKDDGKAAKGADGGAQADRSSSATRQGWSERSELR